MPDPSRLTVVTKKGGENGDRPSLSRQPSIQDCTFGDPGAVNLYKVRRHLKSIRKGRCNCNPHETAKWWAFINLTFAVLDVCFNLIEIVVFTAYVKPFDKTESMNVVEVPLHRFFFLVSAVIHGSCHESFVEIVINFTGKLIYFVSSLMYAFSTVMDKEEQAVTRCLAQWFIFTVWIPPIALFPRFLLNAISHCDAQSSRFFPNSNENGPRIAFWIINMCYLFLMIMWMVQGRLVALNFLEFLKHEHQRSNVRMYRVGGEQETLHTSPSPTSTNILVTAAADKTFRSSALDGILPPGHFMV